MTLRSEIKPALSSSGAAHANFAIIDEAKDYIVVDKPAQLLVHPSKPDGARTLWGELRQLLAFEIANGGQVSIVNRLDRETSGLVLIAKTSEGARRFGLLMQEKRIAKEYLAIVWGWPEWETTFSRASLARQGSFRASPIYLKQAIQAEGAKAETEFRIERRFEKKTSAGDRFALVRAIPRTGRTHQIRVHLAALGHAIVGDKIYGPNEQYYLQFIKTGWTEELERALLLPRHALHSAALQIGEQRWESPLPADLASWSSVPLGYNRRCTLQ